MKRKFWNWVWNEGEKRVLLLDGEISDETWWGDKVTPQVFRSELNAAREMLASGSTHWVATVMQRRRFTIC